MGQRILVVEDDAVLRGAMQRILAGRQHLVDTAGTGRQALQLAESNAPDAILLDLGLPDLSGVEVCRQLRADGVTAPVVVISGHTADPMVQAALAAGAGDYLVKPFRMQDLLTRLDWSLARARGDIPQVVLD